jgi:potassium efflux system protein
MPRYLLLLFFLTAGLCAPVAADELAPDIQRLETIRSLSEKASFPDETSKTDVLRILDEALAALKKAAAVKAQKKELQSTLAKADFEVASHLSLPKQYPVLNDLALKKAPLAELESREQALEQDRTLHQQQLRELEAELARWAGGGRQVAQELKRIRSDLERLGDGSLPSVAAPVIRVDEATDILKASRKILLEAQADLMSLQLANVDRLMRLTEARRKAEEVQLSAINKEYERVSQEILRRRELSARSLAQDLDKEPTGKESLEAEIAGVLREINAVSSYRASLSRRLDEQRRAFERLQQYVSAAPESAVLTGLLRRWVAETRDDMMTPPKALGALLQEAAERHLQLQLELRSESGMDEQERTLRERLSSHLSELMAETRRAMEVKEQFERFLVHSQQFVNRHLLWRRVNDLGSLVSAKSWSHFGDTVWSGLETFLVSRANRISNETIGGLFLLLLGQVLLILSQVRIKSRIKAMGRDARKIRTDFMSLTWRSLFLSGLLALRWPGLLAIVGLLAQAYGGEGGRAWAVGMLNAAAVGYLLEFLGALAIEDGVGHRHFKWHRNTREAIRLLASRFSVPLALGFGLLAGAKEITQYDDFVIPELAGVFLFHGFLWAAGLRLWRFRKTQDMEITLPLWLLVFVGTSAGLMAAAAMGYLYAVAEISIKWWYTLLFITVGLLLRELAKRVIFISRRRVKFEEAMRRLEERRAKAEESETGPVSEPEIPIEEQMADVDLVSRQANKLLTTSILVLVMFGIWWIWADMLPALQGLLDYALPLTVMRDVNGVVQATALTVGDLMLALFLIVATVMVARNLPGLIEMALLNYSDMDYGLRYAVVSLFRYAIWLIGISIIATSVGFRWSEIQWLVAAIGVGLGFGLQEIVANFVSGLVLLFERPIRVGDTVTLDTVSGVVSKIRIRATTITTFDRQEYLVPNKDLIVGRLINWTLSDRLNRLKIEVGVAYGSDVEKATAILLDIVRKEPDVLSEPKPDVLFVGFGDNALLLRVRFFYDNLDLRWELQTRISQKIYKRFNEEGIVIAFPQRDVHLDTSKPMQIEIMGSGARAKGGEAPEGDAKA